MIIQTPPLGSLIFYKEKIVGEIVEIENGIIKAFIKDNEFYEKFFKPKKEVYSMDYKIEEKE